MSQRIRTVQKIGKGRYYTSSWKISDIIWVNILYYICIFPFYALCKWGIYVPAKWCITKIIKKVKQK